GFIPTTPHSAAGWRIEPPVSLPSAITVAPAATAAAGPPLEPPGTRSRFQGLRASLNAEVSVDEPIANSSMFSLPRIGAPCALSRATTVASYGGTKFSSIREAHVVRVPSVQMLSFKLTGIPVKGPTSRIGRAHV